MDIKIISEGDPEYENFKKTTQKSEKPKKKSRETELEKATKETEKAIKLNNEFNVSLDNTKELYSELSENITELAFNNRNLVESYKRLISESDNIGTISAGIIRKLGTSQVNAIEASRNLITNFETDSKKLNKGIDTNTSLINEFEREIEELRKTKGNEVLVKSLQEAQKNLIQSNKQLETFKKITSEIESIKISENFDKFADSIPVLGPLIKKNITTPFKEGVSEAIKSGATSTEALTAGFQNIKKVGLAALFTLLVEETFKVNEQITDLQRNFGLTNGQAIGLRSELSEVAALSGDIFITSEKLLKSFTALSQQLGFQVTTSGDLLETYTNLTQRLGLNEQDATQLTVLSALQSKNTKDVLNNTIKTINNSRDSNKLFNNTKQILQDISSVSSSTIASLGKSPEILAEAATKARELGLNLNQVEKIADSLLNFESSINAELTAELITGKQLNLERARFLALNNDIEGVMKEINKQGINFTEFTEMNRIAQKALAETLGMSREEMTEMLFKQEKLALAQRASRGELEGQSLATFNALSAQEKFTNSVSKLKDLFSSLVIAFSPIIDLIALAAEGIALIVSPLTWLFSQTGKMVGQSVSAITPTPIQDAYFDSSQQGPMIFDKGQLYQGIPGDNILVGTNIPSPITQVSNNTNNLQINNNEIINELKTLKQALVESRSIPVVIENNIDGRQLNKNTMNGARKGYLTTPSVYT
jgi:hypothetical protein